MEVLAGLFIVLFVIGFISGTLSYVVKVEQDLENDDRL
jgi:hypothetical protein